MLRIAKQVSWTFVLRIIGMIASIAVSVFLTRSLGAAGYGVYGTVLSVIALTLVVAQFGYPYLILREVARYLAVDNVDGARLISIRLILSVACLSLVTCLVIGSALATFMPFNGVNDRNIYALAMLTVFLWSINNSLFGILKGLKQVPLVQFIESLFRPGIQFLGLMVFAEVFAGLNVIRAITALIIASVLSVAITVYLTIKLLPNPDSRSREFIPPNKFFRSARSLALVDIMRVFEAQYAVLIAGFFVSLATVGELRLALSLLVFTTLPSTVVGVVVAPFIVDYEKKGQLARLQQLVFFSNGFIVICALLIVISEYLLGPTLLKLIFGTEFTGAHWPLFGFCIAGLIQSLGGNTGSIIMNMTGYEKSLARIFLIAISFGFIVFYVCLPYTGIIAAPIGLIFSELIKTYLVAVSVYRKVGIRCDIFWGLVNRQELIEITKKLSWCLLKHPKDRQ